MAVRGYRLVALFQVALQHEADQVLVARHPLLHQVLPYRFLEGVLLVGIRMAAIDHQRWLHAHLP